jgi:hypothetical protein
MLSKYYGGSLLFTGMSELPLLGSVDGSSRYDATSSRSSDDGPTLPLDGIDRPIVEKRLLCKLDLRVAFLVLVYIMNIVSHCTWCFCDCLKPLRRWTVLI